MTEEEKRQQLALIAERGKIAAQRGLLETARSWRETYRNLLHRKAEDVTLAKRGKTEMRKHEAFPSVYYSSKDVLARPILLTIDFVQQEMVGEGGNQKEAPVAHFKEPNSKLLVVSPTKWDAIAIIAQDDDTDSWPGVKIVLQHGKATFAGKLVDSITIRAPKPTAKPVPIPIQHEDAVDPTDNEIPF